MNREGAAGWYAALSPAILDRGRASLACGDRSTWDTGGDRIAGGGHARATSLVHLIAN